MNKFSAIGGSKKAGFLSVAAILAVLIATLWPFDPFPRNGVRWLNGTNGLKFEEAGIVMSDEPLKLPGPSDQESYTLELLLRPARIRFSQTILAFYSPITGRGFLVKQSTDALQATYDPSVENDKTGTINFYLDHVFHRAELVFLAISSGHAGTTVYVDGQRDQSFPRFQITSRDLSGEMVLGTSPIVYQPWSGDIRGLAVYAKELTPAEESEHYLTWRYPSRHPRTDLEDAIARYTFTEGSGNEIHSEVISAPDLTVPVNRSHSLSQARLEILGSESPLLLD